jgi:hypothetical protein
MSTELNGDGFAARQLAILAAVGLGPFQKPPAAYCVRLPGRWCARALLLQWPGALVSKIAAPVSDVCTVGWWDDESATAARICRMSSSFSWGAQRAVRDTSGSAWSFALRLRDRRGAPGRRWLSGQVSAVLR